MSIDFLKIFGLSFMLMISPIHAASDFEFENIVFSIEFSTILHTAI